MNYTASKSKDTIRDPKDQVYYVWVADTNKKQPNDVHVGLECGSIVLGHNTIDMNKCGGTPLAVVLEEGGITLQYKNTETSVDIIGVDPQVFSKHFLEMLIKVRDESLTHPFNTPKKAPQLEE